MEKKETPAAHSAEAPSTLAQAKLDFLLKKIDTSFQFYLKRKDNNKLKAFRLKMAATVFSGIVSILAGVSLAFDNPEMINVIILLLGAAITVFNTWDNFYNHKELWIKYTDYAIKLNSLRTEGEYLRIEGDSLKMEDVDQIFEEYRLILEEIGQSWVQMRSKPKKEENQGLKGDKKP